jgi:hypothetical protein
MKWGRVVIALRILYNDFGFNTHIYTKRSASVGTRRGPQLSNVTNSYKRCFIIFYEDDVLPFLLRSLHIVSVALLTIENYRTWPSAPRTPRLRSLLHLLPVKSVHIVETRQLYIYQDHSTCKLRV